MLVATDKHLKRSLGLPLLALYGLGNILGAGIYVLVGKVAGFAGYSTTLAFMIAMIIAGITAFSYMELSGRYPVSASISVYLHKAFGKRWFSVLIGLAMVGGGVASAAALAQGFAGYFATFINVPIVVGSVGLLVATGLLAIKGISESAKAAAAITVIEVIGLLLIIWFGRSTFSNVTSSEIFSIDPVFGLGGLIAGTFIAFYAFIGFEDMVNVAEEVKNPRRTMPLAILIALAVSTALYILVVVVAINLIPPAELAQSSAPLSLVFERSSANSAIVLSAIGMVAAINGVLVQVIMGSRILYGLSKQGWLPSRLSEVHRKFNTPALATLVVLASMILATLLLPLVSLAQITSLLVLTIFVFVNLSLIVIKHRFPTHQGYITVPSVVPYSGVVLCVSLILYQLYSWT